MTGSAYLYNRFRKLAPAAPANWEGAAGQQACFFERALAKSPSVETGLTNVDVKLLGYSVAQTMAAVLKASADNLTRENVMKQAASIHTLKLPTLLPGSRSQLAPMISPR
jgi:hypothetical protein